MPKGYGVFLDFHDKFGIDCKSNDRVAVSSKRLFYKSRPRGDAYTALFCGVSRIPNVTVPNRVMWVRFQAHSPDTGGIGFKATYTKFGKCMIVKHYHNAGDTRKP